MSSQPAGAPEPVTCLAKLATSAPIVTLVATQFLLARAEAAPFLLLPDFPARFAPGLWPAFGLGATLAAGALFTIARWARRRRTGTVIAP